MSRSAPPKPDDTGHPKYPDCVSTDVPWKHHSKVNDYEPSGPHIALDFAVENS